MESTPAPTSVRAWCLRVLEGGALADKLASAAAVDGSVIPDEPGPALLLRAPARDGVLRMAIGSQKLPRLGELTGKDARIATLSRFAHHELMAVELFAWALLAFPALPAPLRRGLLAAAAEEQAHLALYIERIQAHGAQFGDVPLSDYFWQLVPAISKAADPALAFLCAQGLTLEQANLDFSMLYRDAFARAGDVDSAGVCQRVHDDEIGHVRLARTWVERLSGKEDVVAYDEHVPFPLSAARAKGRRFEQSARTKAGLSPAFIERVRHAKPYEHRSLPANTVDES